MGWMWIALRWGTRTSRDWARGSDDGVCRAKSVEESAVWMAVMVEELM